MVRRERFTERAVPPVAETGVVAGEPRAAQTSAQREDAGAKRADGLRGGEPTRAVDGEGARVVEHDAPVRAERDVHVLAGDDAEVIDGPARETDRDAVARAVDAPEVTPRARRRAGRGRVGHPRSGRVGHLDGEGITRSATEGANGKLPEGGRMVYTPIMPYRNIAALPKRKKTMTRRQAATHANQVRWARERAKHYDALQQLRGRVITAESSIAALARDLPDAQREAIDVALAQLVGGFHELWQFSGHDLPVHLRDYAAGVVDELRRQAAVREVTPG